MKTLTAEFLKCTKEYVTLGGVKTQEDVASDIICSYCVEKDYLIGKNKAYDLFSGRSIYKADIVEYFWSENNHEYLVDDIVKMILSNVYWKEEYISKLLLLVKTVDTIPEEYLQEVFYLIETKQYAEAVAEIFKVVIGHDLSAKKRMYSSK